ncbi:MAG: hypothetical protein JSS83_14565 [Cyanobacteria bacterium SZAS LIN-3]|nr:hypothetical protein [Cyanobacteria bacterium SZAS LIN-3]
MPATVLSRARSFAVKTWLVVGLGVAMPIGWCVFEIDYQRRELSLETAATDGRHFKPSYYDCGDNEAMASKIFEVEETADLAFDGRGLKRRDVRSGIADCLKKARHKDLLVVWSWCRQPDELANLRLFADAVGAKRLLILGRHCQGVSVE